MPPSTKKLLGPCTTIYRTEADINEALLLLELQTTFCLAEQCSMYNVEYSHDQTKQHSKGMNTAADLEELLSSMDPKKLL